jgi:hypothetical protein
MTTSRICSAWRAPGFPGATVGASRTGHIDDAISSLAIDLGLEEIAPLEGAYTPRHDFQGISDDAELERIMRALPNFTTAEAVGH